MSKPYRYYVRSPDAKAIFGFDEYEAAKRVALEYGEGSYIIDTLAQAYIPMLQEVAGGEIRYAGFGGWDTGKFGLDRDLIEAVKKGHAALVHAFLAKGASPDACDANGGPALTWAVATGKANIVALLLAEGAAANAGDADGTTALDVARERNKTEIAEFLLQAGAVE